MSRMDSRPKTRFYCRFKIGMSFKSCTDGKIIYWDYGQ